MRYSRHAALAAAGLAAWLLLLVGCQQQPSSPPPAAPVLRVNASPAAPVASEVPLAQDTLSRPVPPAVVSPGSAGRKTNAPRPVRRDPTRRSPATPAAALPTAPRERRNPEPPAPIERPKPVPPPPRLELPQPEYPTAPARKPPSPSPNENPPSNSPTRLTASNGLGAARTEAVDSELFLLDEEPARPVYHPAVVIDEWRDEQWLTVRFDISPNGRFRVALLEGTGDPALDALALDILRQWRWEPKKVKRRPVASTEILRLKRNVTRRG